MRRQECFNHRLILTAICLLSFGAAVFVQAEESPYDVGMKGYVAKIRPDFRIGAYYLISHRANGETTNESNQKRADFITKHFNAITLSFAMDKTQPTADSWALSERDVRLEYLKARSKQDFIAHLVIGWNIYNPDWFNNASFTPAQLEDKLDERLKKLVGGYRDDLWTVQVVNEAFQKDGTWRIIKNDQWMNMGFETKNGYRYPKYLEVAFRKAREYGGDNMQLLYNENRNGMTTSIKAKPCLDLFTNFKALGIPIDGVGIQLHCTIQDGKVMSENDASGPEMDWSKLNDYMNQLGKAGAVVQVTEFDVRLPSDPTPADYELQADAYRNALKTCMENPYCQKFQIFYISDQHTPGGFKSGIIDDNDELKPAFFAMMNYLIERVGGLKNSGSDTHQKLQNVNAPQ